MSDRDRRSENTAVHEQGQYSVLSAFIIELVGTELNEAYNPEHSRYSAEIPMNSFNPYAQAGWSTPSQSSVASLYLATDVPPFLTFGMLPSQTVEISPHWITYTFSSLDEDILDCAVIGPNGKSILDISTSLHANDAGITTFTGLNGVPYAQIEWSRSPLVEISGVIPKQKATTWIKQSASSPCSRTMQFQSREYVWERYKETLYLYTTYYEPGHDRILLAKFRRLNQVMVLQVLPNAFVHEVLNPFIVALMLLTVHDLQPL
ncbi:hypothetical protein BDN70DRAFT_898697 [Pholiota conissans]|uniref:Uncharacterized protein n=1 Tax=Pholiota conissans TaxID=109636 RepID=A0A9P6CW24_9AGAR|nr:hypothetical protein BDN70DRAFT_898697 [Pholiota conissans]